MPRCQNLGGEMPEDKVVVIGGGGHAKVVISTLLACGIKIEGVLDDDETKIGKDILGVPVIGNIENLSIGKFKYAIIAIGDNSKRKEIAREYGNNCEWISAIHPKAYIAPGVSIGKGTIVFAGAVIQPGTEIGDHVIINTGAIVDHDCKVDNFVHVAPGCKLAGGVSVKEGVLLGIGSCVIPGVTVGSWSVVGAGSVVIRDVPSFSKIKGVPAK